MLDDDIFRVAVIDDVGLLPFRDRFDEPVKDFGWAGCFTHFCPFRQTMKLIDRIRSGGPGDFGGLAGRFGIDSLGSRVDIRDRLQQSCRLIARAGVASTS